MTGLKSGSGDDLWGDENGGDSTEETTDTEATSTTEDPQPSEEISNSDSADTRSETPTTSTKSTGETRPYIVRRAIEDKSVQFERDERLTFFVHDDVADGERELITELESALGRGVPKFDVREAVYRAALRNREDVLDELLKMGYSRDEE